MCNYSNTVYNNDGDILYKIIVGVRLIPSILSNLILSKSGDSYARKLLVTFITRRNNYNDFLKRLPQLFGSQR